MVCGEGERKMKKKDRGKVLEGSKEKSGNGEEKKKKRRGGTSCFFFCLFRSK